MPTSTIDSVIFRDIFGDADMRRVWSDENRTQRYLDFEAALARAQASIGMISKEAAAEVTRVCKVENIDFVQLEKETLNIGYPVLGVVHQIARLCKGDAGNYCHWGATTQDITDTATVLQMRESFELLGGMLDAAMAFGFPAIAFTGIPILTPLIGSNATVVVDFAGLTGNIIILPTTLVLLSFAQARGDGSGGDWHSTGDGITTALKGSLLQPVVLSPLLAIALVLLNVRMPGVVSSSFGLLGSTVGGISLFASGVILQSQSLTVSLPAAISSVARLLVIPGLTFAVLMRLGVSGDELKMAVLALGLAAAPMQVILSTRYRTDEQENASVLLYTNVLCIPTLAFFIWLTRSSP
jgi:predicted permease